ncbi:MAG: hypothetical protein NC084_09185 [Bacteroides sp.]|nr:hypothetical protein [Eubacterium sp.]MCM1419009.1 hypothetical protein [Roseburia sp.]MCM1462869.1 hypothetical protein [Bacteroides sp.]
MKKPYIVGLKHGTWRSEVWFSGEDDPRTEEAWKKAVDGLTEVGTRSANSNEFLSAAVAHFEKNGFTRIQR